MPRPKAPETIDSLLGAIEVLTKVIGTRLRSGKSVNNNPDARKRGWTSDGQIDTAIRAGESIKRKVEAIRKLREKENPKS